MRRFLFTTLLFLFCGSFISLGWAGESGSFIGHNPPWGSGIENFPYLVEYKTAGDIKYYQKPYSDPVSDQMAGIRSYHVTYGFKNDKLYARILKIDTVDDFQKALDHMVASFGEPKEKVDDNTYIARWQTLVLKVKLKYNKENKSMKIGTYYMPIAGNEFDLEKNFDATP